jgi:hypothetical protein
MVLLAHLQRSEPFGVLCDDFLDMLPSINAEVEQKRDGGDGNESGRRENTQSKAGMPEGLEHGRGLRMLSAD